MENQTVNKVTPKIVDLTGSPVEIGAGHGEELRGLIRAAVEHLEHALERERDRDPRKLIESFFARTDFMTSIELHAPELLEEMRGIARGAGLPLRDVLLLNLMDELWWFDPRDEEIGCESGGAKVGHGSGGIMLLRAE